MKILAIETSCDETSASVVENGVKIITNIVATSSPIHTKTGGIIPENAARQQLISMVPVLNEALEKISKAKTTTHQKKSLSPNQYIVNEIDALAVTYGPGLIGSLLVGVETAKTLSYYFSKPLIPINHLIAHIYANWLATENTCPNDSPKFPALALVVSGGHTDLVLMKSHGEITWIGGTRDDAAGEAFDKTARLLGLPYPGGPSISLAAEKYLSFNNRYPKLNQFPRPMIGGDNFDFSFSGLKTSVYNYVKGVGNRLTKDKVCLLSAEVQEAVVDVLVSKCIKAVNKYRPKSFLLAGGVSANKRLREKFTESLKVDSSSTTLYIPPINLCTDNAANIASCAFFNYRSVGWEKVFSNPGLSIND